LLTYTEKLGFNEEKRQARTHLLGLGDADRALATYLRDKVIDPNAEEIVAQMYRILHQNKQFQMILSKGYELPALESTLCDYVRSLGIGFDSEEYFESRLRIGMVHIWVGVDLSLYQCTYRILQQLLIDAIPQDSSQRDLLIAYILKITTLDMSLAIEAYHGSQIGGLLASLDEQKHLNSELFEQVSHDHLTGVLSRESFIDVLRLALLALNDKPHPFSVLMLDFDHFKDVNDVYGHLAGDEVLKEVSGRIEHTLRQHDAIGRYGGEEFIVLLTGVGVDIGLDVAERIRNRVAADPVRTDEHTINVTVSMGLAQARAGEELLSLIDRADQALYRAKQGGRNRVEIDDATGD
jgi:diguanylate cyclase (GGDEF)-like protein